jgi:microcystin-dependent protein
MSEPYLGEIRMFGGNYAPLGWAFCNGQLLPISQNDALFSLIGTTYGGDGQTTFALPDLRGRVPIHQGTANPIGSAAGSETVTLTQSQMPQHTHAALGSGSEVEGSSPAGSVFAAGTDTPFYAPFNPSKAVAMSAAVVGSSGGSQPHENMQPYLCVSFIIALEGIFPSQG